MILIEIPEYQHYVIFVDPGVSTIKNNRLVFVYYIFFVSLFACSSCHLFLPYPMSIHSSIG